MSSSNVATGTTSSAQQQGIPEENNGSSVRPERATQEDWEDEKASNQAVLQGLVERLHDKGEKEVLRVLKVGTLISDAVAECSFGQAIEFDKRLASSFPRLQINRDIRDRILELALEDEGGIADGTPWMSSGR